MSRWVGSLVLALLAGSVGCGGGSGPTPTPTPVVHVPPMTGTLSLQTKSSSLTKSEIISGPVQTDSNGKVTGTVYTEVPTDPESFPCALTLTDGFVLNGGFDANGQLSATASFSIFVITLKGQVSSDGQTS